MLFFPDCSTVIWGAPRHVTDTPRCVAGAPRLVVGAPNYSAGQQECPPRVWYSPEIDTSKFTLHILSDTPGGFQYLKYILLMQPRHGSLSSLEHGFQVHHQTGSITASKCISYLLNHSLGVYLWGHSILASKCISDVAQSRPPCASLSYLDLGLQVRLKTHSIMAS